MADFEVKVEDAGQIHDLVDESLRRASEEGLTRLLLDHEEEPNVVRGRSEKLLHQDREEIVETARPDGGESWYHDSGSKCFTLAVPEGGKKHSLYMEIWSQALIQELEELGYDAEMRDGDIYEVEDLELGEQLVGLSLRNNGSTVVRACWYEEEPDVDEILEADGKSREEFYSSIKILDGLYNRLEENLEPEKLDYDSFVSEQIKASEPATPEGGREPTPCPTRKGAASY